MQEYAHKMKEELLLMGVMSFLMVSEHLSLTLLHPARGTCPRPPFSTSCSSLGFRIDVLISTSSTHSTLNVSLNVSHMSGRLFEDIKNVS
jgi:hypothetical protein